MASSSPPSEKPRAAALDGPIARLPKMTVLRRFYRRLIQILARWLVHSLTRPLVQGLENIPLQGPGLLVSNHLGDGDVLLGLAYAPRSVEIIAKTELRGFPVLGNLLAAYGMIWIHRGLPDRPALRTVQEAFLDQRLVAIAPEGRESLTGALEEGTQGAAYLALKGRVPVIPITVTGTENTRIFSNLKRLRRTSVTLTVGPPFHLQPQSDQRASLQAGTRMIMTALANQLPPEYRGSYANELENQHGS